MSALTLGMTAGVAAAANYPSPFVVGGTADVAIVYGTGSGVSALDAVQAGNIQTNLQSFMGTDSSSSTTVSGEAYELFTSSSKIWMNESINSVRGTVTETNLPTILAEGDFEGDVSADYTQQIKMGSYSKLDFGQHPTSDEDPVVAFKLSADTLYANHLYNYTLTFDQKVNLTHSDSIGSSIEILGKSYTVGAGTTTTKLYLYESAETTQLSIGGDDPTSATMTIEGEDYTIELISATDSSARIKVTDSSGDSDTKSIDEDNSKKIQGIDVAVNYANEDTATNRLIAEITIGTNKLLLQDGKAIKQGTDEDTIKGTKVKWSSAATNWIDVTSFDIVVGAEDADVDALVAGESFVDPVFGTFKIDFSVLKGDDDRETITVSPSSHDKAKVEFTTHGGKTKSIYWFNNDTGDAILSDTSRTDVFNLIEMAEINYTQYAVVGNEDTGYLVELTTCENETGQSDDEIVFTDAMDPSDSPKTWTVTSTGANGGTVNIGGADYTVSYGGDSSSTCWARLNYPDSTTANEDAVIFPTIETSKGSKLFFYEPQNVSALDWDGTTGHNMSTLRFPDGNEYSDVDITYSGEGPDAWTLSTSATGIINTTSTGDSEIASIGQFHYNISGGGGNGTFYVRLLEPEDGATEIDVPAIGMFYEEDDNNEYQGLVVVMENTAASSNNKVGVKDVQTTYMNDSGLTYSTNWDDIQLESDDDMYYSMDLWGTLIKTDHSDTDQYDAVIEYPDEQVNANIYVAEEGASITGGTTGGSTQLGDVLVKDSEVSSVSSKNLIVVGGSCINSAAATLVGGAYCGSAWTSETDVGSGQFLIQSFGDAYTSGKIALLVAGYDAADTVNAATYLRTQTVDTGADNKYVGTSATNAELVVE